MAGASGGDIESIRTELRIAVNDCQDRCLYISAKWAGELLNALPEEIINDDGDMNANSSHEPVAPSLGQREMRLRRREMDRYAMAKSFFDCKEYDRCAVTLMPSLLPQQPVQREGAMPSVPSTPGKGKGKVPSPQLTRLHKPDIPQLSQRSLFLALYSRYIAGEKRKEENSEMVLGPADGPVTANKELVTLTGVLEEYFARLESSNDDSHSDGFLEYLYAVILIKSRNEDLAKQWLLRSVKLYEWNWSAWQELTGLISSMEDLAAVQCSQELYQSSDALHDKITQLSTVFPASAFLQTQRALLHYHAKDFDSAATIFSSILQSHPYRLDNLDIYSNILYVMETARPKLSYLATLTSAIDRFRPETCCIIGNHYSKSSEHEKAVIYFRRALTLDRSFLSAWTLMGHEYIELKNTQAAIESYRRAVDANKKDYRAWHGLGLGYEILDLHSYALYYYQKAAALQPWDPKMWAAVAACYEKCGRAEHAVRSYKRALAAGSYAERGGIGGVGSSFGSGGSGEVDPLAGVVGGRLDPDILHQIAVLYEGLGEGDEAAAYMELCLAQEEGPDEEDLPPGVSMSSMPAGVGVTQTTSKARLWLARWAMAKGGLERCMELANELCQDGYEVEEAKGLIKDARGRLGEQSSFVE